MHKEIAAADLQPGQIVDLKTGPHIVSHTITYAPLTASQSKRFVDVFFVGQSYPLYFREDVEVNVIGFTELEAELS